MNKFKEFLLKLLGKDMVDGFTEEQLQVLADFEKETETKVDPEPSSIFKEGYKNEDGSINIDLIADSALNPEAKEVLSHLVSQIQTLTGQVSTITTERDTLSSDFNQYKRGNTLKTLLSDGKVVDADDFIKLYKEDIDKYSDETLETDITTLLDSVKGVKPHLFTSETAQPQPGFNPPPASSNTGYYPGMSFKDAFAAEEE